MDVSLVHVDSEHFADPFVVRVTDPPNGSTRKAQRLAAVEQDQEHAARMQFPFSPLGDAGRAEDLSCRAQERRAPPAISISV